MGIHSPPLPGPRGHRGQDSGRAEGSRSALRAKTSSWLTTIRLVGLGEAPLGVRKLDGHSTSLGDWQLIPTHGATPGPVGRCSLSQSARAAGRGGRSVYALSAEGVVDAQLLSDLIDYLGWTAVALKFRFTRSGARTWEASARVVNRLIALVAP